MERKDRNKNGGGVFVAVSDDHETCTVEHSDADCEIIWTEIQTDNKNVLAGSFYRPPNATIESLEQLNESLYKIKEKCKDKIIILAGDFNLPHINWETLSVKSGCHQSNQHHRLLDIVSEHGLEQMQPHATREDNNLDLYLTSHPSLVKTCDAVPGISDHNMVVIDSEIKPRYKRPKRRKIYQYEKANWDNIKDRMMEISRTVCESADVEESWTMLKNEISECLDLEVPSKLTAKRHNLPWLNRKLINKIRRKHKLYQKAKQSHKKEDWDKYKTHKSATLEQGNNKSFWKYIKSKRSDSIGIAGLKQQGVLHQDSKAKAEILNSQFKSVFTKEDPNEELPEISEKCYPSISNLEITVEGVEKLLRNLNVSKASGPDNIPNTILKTCSIQLAPAITHIFTLSVNSGSLPEDWRNADITPIFKKGNKHEAANYRPVSLTSVCCKTLEHIICRHILKHLEKHHILTKLQHGFRSGNSCESQLIITMEDIMYRYDQKKTSRSSDFRL